MPRHYDGLFPETPYGYFSIVPDFVDAMKIPGITTVWQTNGISVMRDGNWEQALDAKAAVMKSAQAGSRVLPFRADNVFLSAQRVASDTYRVFLIDPGYVEPTGVTTQLSINLKSKQIEVRDTITGKSLPVAASSVTVSVPAGTFSILDVVVTK
jgi:hypothetical protein